MIANERQYKVTRKKLGELARLRESLDRGDAGDEGFEDLQGEALDSVLDDLQGELAEYEGLKSGQTTTIESVTLGGMADALIKSRIARGWTQAELARRLGVAEQQVQRDEANHYSGAALSRLSEIAATLDIEIHGTITLRAG